MKHLALATAACALLFSPLILPAAETTEDEYPEGMLSEDKQIALLIQATEHTTSQLKALQMNLSAFRTQEALCLQFPSNAEFLYKLSECALKLLTSIHATHVEPYFRLAFLEELEKISKIAKNRVIPPICIP